MGYSTKKYTGPDGTQYEVAEDGSLTKIGRSTSGETDTAPSKYQISESGEIYRIEDDGSITYLTNIENVNNHPIQDSEQPITRKSKKSKTWKWIIGLIILALGIRLYCIFGHIDAPIEAVANPDNPAELTQEQNQEGTALVSDEVVSEQIVETPPHFNEVREYKSDIDEDHVFCYVFYPDGVCGRFECDLEYSSINIGTYSRNNDELMINLNGEPKTILNYDDNRLWYSNCEVKRVLRMESSETAINQLTSDGIEYQGYGKDNKEYKLKFYKSGNRNNYLYTKISHQENGGNVFTFSSCTQGIFDVKDKVLHLKSGMVKDIYLFNTQFFIMDDIYFHSMYIIDN